MFRNDLIDCASCEGRFSRSPTVIVLMAVVVRPIPLIGWKDEPFTVCVDAADAFFLSVFRRSGDRVGGCGGGVGGGGMAADEAERAEEVRTEAGRSEVAREDSK